MSKLKFWSTDLGVNYLERNVGKETWIRYHRESSLSHFLTQVCPGFLKQMNVDMGDVEEAGK